MESELNRHDSDTTLNRNESRYWIEKVFQKRECCRFTPSIKHPERCSCGRPKSQHYGLLPATIPYLGTGAAGADKWSPQSHTEVSYTDAYGTVEFQGGAHPTKAQFVRLSYDTPPELILQLLQTHWNLELPKLLISVHGGILNFDLQPKLKRVFRKGLLKAAKTTGAWIVSAGINTGVVRHVGDALGDTLVQARNKVVTIGCAPWGVVHNRSDLVGRDCVTPYHAIAAPKANSVVLNSNHAYFLLVDNGTVGKYGCEIILRKKLEKFIQQQKLQTRSGSKNYSTPVLCLVLEGGVNTIRTVLECITDSPPVPVVVCDGSGRAADLLAFTHKYAQDDGTMPETLRDQLILTVEKTFQYSREQAEKLFIELMLCVKKKELITVFRMGEESQDIDLAILTALLKAQNSSCTDQLSLALAWNRVDIARSHIFLYGQEWPEGTLEPVIVDALEGALEQAMMDALVNDRVDFVKLLIENGVSMHKWLTISRLEELYNIKQDPGGTLRYLVRDYVKKSIPANYRYHLCEIGLVIEQLMGGAYRASFCRKRFRSLYSAIMKKSSDFESDPNHLNRRGTLQKGLGHHISNIITELPLPISVERVQEMHVFHYPFHELMVWAVLMKRQRMAKFMWQHGEEALAKALIASKLYKSMAHEAAQDDLEVDISIELKQYAREFGQLAIDLLEQCFKTDDDMTLQLLTYELSEWSDQTCLSLAVSANHRELIAHTCCQILLTEMWMGALRTRRYTSLKVIMGILCFPSIVFLEFKTKEEMQLMSLSLDTLVFNHRLLSQPVVIMGILFFPSIVFLEFKTKEEMQLMPQTVEEHIQELEDSDSSDSDDTDSSISSSVRRARKHDRETALDATKPLSNGSVFPEWSLVAMPSKKSPLRLGKKIYEFYTAPITKFWLHTFGYFAFLTMMSYTVLVRMSSFPTWLEWYTIAYIFTLFLEKWREVIVSEPKKVSQKLYVYYTEVWNICDTIAIILFVAGAVLRFIPPTLGHGKVFYCVAIVFWYIRLLDIFSVSKFLGPYVTMIGKMMKDLLNFVVILLIVLMSFGIVRQAVTYPDEQPNWHLFKNVFLKPYFMIYGEVYAGEIDPSSCVDDPQGEDEVKCTPGRWIVPAVMAVYLIVANILLINLLIAVFNNTFYQVNAISNQIWKFQRYSLVIEYESKPILPPPFIVVCHLYLLIRFFIRQCRGKQHHFDNGLKLFIDKEEVEKVHDFEEEAMEDLFRHKDDVYRCSTDERIRLTNERVENMSLRLDDINQKENTVRLSMQTVDYRLAKLEDLVLQSLAGIDKLQTSISGLKQLAVSESAATSMHLYPAHKPRSHSPSKARLPQVKNIAAQVSRFDLRYSPQRKKSRNEERLRPFTDYTKKHPRRPPLNRSVTVGTPVPLSKELEEIYTSYATGHIPANISQEAMANVKVATSDLWERRRRKRNINRGKQGKGSQRATSLQDYSPLDERHEMAQAGAGPRSGTKVTFSDSHSGGISMDKEQGVAARPVSQPMPIPYSSYNSAQSKSTAPDYASRPASLVQSCSEDSALPQDVATDRDIDEAIVETYGLLHPSEASGSGPERSRPHVTMPPATPIITPTRVEYTTITDDIDTSCLNYCSPRGSPTTPKPMAFAVKNSVDLYTKKESRFRRPRARIAESEAQQLKSAEEAEHEEMEMVLRKRMRQISLTERDSLGDIATLFINEVDTSSSSSSDDEPQYYSDEETRSLALNGVVLERMRHANSEPSIKISVSPDLSEQTQDTTKCKSQSPLGEDAGERVDVAAFREQFVFPKTRHISAGAEPKKC